MIICEHPVTTRTYILEISKHGSTDHLLVTSPDMPGLFVHGESLEHIRERAPGVIQRYMERKGLKVEDVTIEPAHPQSPTHAVTKSKSSMARSKSSMAGGPVAPSMTAVVHLAA